MIYLQLFWEFFRIGLFAVGGGMATLPFLEQLSVRTGWYGPALITDMIAVSESTPGPIGINMATYVGCSVAGMAGGVAATLGEICPAILIVTLVLGIKFLVRPVTATKESMSETSPRKRALQSVVLGSLAGIICGFVGAGGGMMMLFVLTTVLGYELKTALGTSLFIMAFSALIGAGSHFIIGGMPDLLVTAVCAGFTLIWAKIAAIFANKASQKTLNRATGGILVAEALIVLAFKYLL